MGTKKTKRVWVLCEAFTLTGDAFGHETIHKSLTPWACVYPTRKACMDALAKCVVDRVSENYEGLDESDYDLAAEVAEVMTGYTADGKCRRYNYSASDREVVWRVYPVKIEVATWDWRATGRKQRGSGGKA